MLILDEHEFSGRAREHFKSLGIELPEETIREIYRSYNFAMLFSDMNRKISADNIIKIAATAYEAGRRAEAKL